MRILFNICTMENSNSNKVIIFKNGFVVRKKRILNFYFIYTYMCVCVRV